MQTLIRNLRFQYLKPSKFVEGLKKPDGIGSLTPNDAQMRLTVQGEKRRWNSWHRWPSLRMSSPCATS